jgi:hypothetical protein
MTSFMHLIPTQRKRRSKKRKKLTFADFIPWLLIVAVGVGVLLVSKFG